MAEFDFKKQTIRDIKRLASTMQGLMKFADHLDEMTGLDKLEAESRARIDALKASKAKAEADATAATERLAKIAQNVSDAEAKLAEIKSAIESAEARKAEIDAELQRTREKLFAA